MRLAALALSWSLVACGGSAAPAAQPAPADEPAPAEAKEPAETVEPTAAPAKDKTCCCEVWLEGPEHRWTTEEGCTEGTDEWVASWDTVGSCAAAAECED
jgi:hypothetical protein